MRGVRVRGLVSASTSASGSAAAANMIRRNNDIPVVDMKRIRTAVLTFGKGSKEHVAEIERLGADIRRIYSTIGFAYLINHGLDRALIADMFRQHGQFFDQTLSRKEELHFNKMHGFRGYIAKGQSKMAKIGIKRTHLKEEDVKPQLQEALVFASENPGTKLHGRDAYPQRLSGFKETLCAYRTAVTSIAQLLVPCFGAAIDTSDLSAFEKCFETPTTFLRLNYYPPAQPNIDPYVNMAGGIHSDYGSFTILAPGSPGLQVRTPDDAHWIDLPPVEGSLVLNIGDFLHKWSGGKLRATPHRVIHKDTENGRQSIAFFFDPHMSTVEPNTGLQWGDHLYSRLNANYAGQLKSLTPTSVSKL